MSQPLFWALGTNHKQNRYEHCSCGGIYYNIKDDNKQNKIHNALKKKARVVWRK